MNGEPANVLVLGLGETGVSMAAWLARSGSRVRVADTRERPPGLEQLRAAVPDVELCLGGAGEDLLDGIDLLAISPGVPREIPVVGKALARGIPVRGDVELFAREVQAGVPRPRIVAITGTNGKSTVTALTGAMCREAGWDAEVAGNISPAVLDALMRRASRGQGAARGGAQAAHPGRHDFGAASGPRAALALHGQQGAGAADAASARLWRAPAAGGRRHAGKQAAAAGAPAGCR